MTGKTADEIIAALQCRPTSISSMAHGVTLLQWQATGCHMSLLFDAYGEFIKITHQFANYASATGCATLIALLGILAAIIAFAVR